MVYYVQEDDDELLKDLEKIVESEESKESKDNHSINTGNFNEDNNHSLSVKDWAEPRPDVKSSQEPEKPHSRRIKSSLSMIDEISLEKISRGDIEKIKDMVSQSKTVVKQTTIEADNHQRELSFKGGDVSMNKTIWDGSVIIHTGNKNLNTSQIKGYLDNSGFDTMNYYYGVNEKGMTTQLNISCFDNQTANVSAIENTTQKQVSHQIPEGRPMLSTLEGLKKKAMENKVKNAGETKPAQVLTKQEESKKQASTMKGNILFWCSRDQAKGEAQRETC